MHRPVIDFGHLRDEAAMLRGLLKRAQLPVDFGKGLASLARFIRDHKHFESLLSEADPEWRKEMYEALAPNLRFQAKPLDVYIAGAKQMAEREQLPVLDVNGNLQPFKPAQDVQTAQKAIAAALAEKTLTLKCAKCTTEEQFHQIGEETAVDVRKKALKAGWILVPEEICPHCPTSLRPNA